jgi:hypothetical protein
MFKEKLYPFVQFISKDFYSAFIEFENELSAALIIMVFNETRR